MLQQSQATAPTGRRSGPAPLTLPRFCAALGEALAAAPADAAPRIAAGLLPGLLAEKELLPPEQRAVPEKGYGRYCVFACPHETFSVLAMVWPSGVVSPIHDHLTWCAFGVYEGVLEECRYNPAADGKRATLRETITHRPGAVAHLPVDAPNIHRMHNPTERATITIHVYGGDSNKLGPNLRQVWDA